jgi:hypothetical protein
MYQFDEPILDNNVVDEKTNEDDEAEWTMKAVGADKRFTEKFQPLGTIASPFACQPTPTCSSNLIPLLV